MAFPDQEAGHPDTKTNPFRLLFNPGRLIGESGGVLGQIAGKLRQNIYFLIKKRDAGMARSMKPKREYEEEMSGRRYQIGQIINGVRRRQTEFADRLAGHSGSPE